MTLLYHITHVSNLPGILADGGLWCDRIRHVRKVRTTGIAHEHIKQRRANRQVKTLRGRVVAEGGTLADYVPFYFAPRSPMLFTIHRGNVDGYKGGQKDIVYLVSTVKRAVSAGRPWCFTEGHAEMAYTEYFDDLDDLAKLDWPLMEAQYWGGDDERRRRRQAEFLVHEFYPLTAIKSLAVMGIDARKAVEYYLLKAGLDLPVQLKPEWYY